jgi:L-ascorbate metabolism protein UlaG (beta-lactamase superfamily)
VETAATRLLVDPFFGKDDARLYPPPEPEAYAAEIDVLLVTHEHVDHLDRSFLPVLAQHSPRVQVVVPKPIVAEAAGLVGDERVTGVEAGQELALAGDLSVRVVPAVHALVPADGYSTGDGRFVGYVVATPELALYHAGDTLVTDELIEHLRAVHVDVAFLPINGRDADRESRDIAGNMNFREAVDLGVRIGASTLVPVHWDMFAGNTEQPGRAVDEAAAAEADLHVVVLRRFRPFVFAASSS